MARLPRHPLRIVTAEERSWLEQISRASQEPAAHVARAKALLAVASGLSFVAAARRASRRSGDAVARLVQRFNQEGLHAVADRPRSGRPARYSVAERSRILAEAQRTPDRTRDRTTTWSLTTLCHCLRTTTSLTSISPYTIWCVLHGAGWQWQRTRTWCPTGTALRKRQHGTVTVTDPDTVAKQHLIELAYTAGPSLGVDVWCFDEAGPYQTMPYPGLHWHVTGHPARQGHEYERTGTAKLLTLFHPCDGRVRLKGVTSCTNAIVHPWLERELLAILEALPTAPVQETSERCGAWERWQAGLQHAPAIGTTIPPLRLLLVLDNLASHKTPQFVRWCTQHGIMLLYTPLGGSWLNMAESIQRLLKRRALDGQHPQHPQDIINWFEAVAAGWNRDPTPFEWGGKRAARRVRARVHRHTQGGSGACTYRAVRRRPNKLEQWHQTLQLTH